MSRKKFLKKQRNTKMSEKYTKNNTQAPKTEMEAPESTTIQDEPVIDTVEELGEDESDVEGRSEVEVLKDDLQAANEALEKEKKEYLFLMAEFDNYRKRTIKEKAEIIKNASERALLDLLPIVDDFERSLKALESNPESADALEGVNLIYKKIVKYLNDHGVKAMESTGADFNPDNHEAIATIPAPDESLKGKVIDTTTTGYTINDKVLRHAKVVVGE